MLSKLSTILGVFLSQVPIAQADVIAFGRNDGSNAYMQVWSNPSNLGLRYRHDSDDLGVETQNDLQLKLSAGFNVGVLRNKVRLEINGRTGEEFSSIYLNTGLGKSDSQSIFGIRRFNLGFGPWAGIDFQVGSMAPKYGKSSEATYLSRHGWLNGYRARYTSADWGVVSTTGYLAHTAKDRGLVDFYQRFDRMNDFNFNHTLFTHALSSKLGYSFGYLYFRPASVSHYLKTAFSHDIGSDWVDSYGAELTYQIAPRLSAASAVRVGRKFGHVFGSLPLKVTLKYLYKTKSFNLPVGNRVLAGHSGWLALKVPKVFTSDLMGLDIFAHYVQNFSDFDSKRMEFGLAMNF